MNARIHKTDDLHEVVNLLNHLPEFSPAISLHVMEDRLRGKKHLILVAYVDELPVGFKLGYDRYGEGSFYSWLGGVLPAYRRSGIATQLLRTMESWMLNNGYSVLRFKTRNCHRSMLLFALQNGFLISGFEQKEPIGLSRIEMLKHLV